MWHQSGKLGETDDCGHSGHSLFQYECVSTNQNGMLLYSHGSLHHTVRKSTCVCSIHNIVQLYWKVSWVTAGYTLCLYKCIDLIKIGLPKIFLPQDGWTALDQSSLKLTAQVYIPWLVPNTCGFCVMSFDRTFIDNMRYSLSYECGIVWQGLSKLQNVGTLSAQEWPMLLIVKCNQQ